MADFNQYFDGTLPPQGPVTITGALTAGRARLGVTSLNARLDSNHLGGRFTLDLAGKRPAFTARLHSKQLDLTLYKNKKIVNKQKDKNIFSSKKLNLAMLRQYTVDLQLQAASPTTRDLHFEDLNLQLQSTEGQWRLHSKGRLADGNLDADITIEPRETSAVVAHVPISSNCSRRNCRPYSPTP